MSAVQKALILSAPLGEYAVKPVAIPKPTVGQLLIKVEAAALNPSDWKFQTLGFFADSYPITQGFDGAGIVEDVGSDVSGFRKGDRVVFQAWHDEAAKFFHGTFQQYTVVPTYSVSKISSNISFAEASTLFCCVATIGISLFSQKPGTESLRLTPPWETQGRGKYAGKSIFIVGGASNVGQFAIQFAKLSGFSHIITTASLHNADLVKSFGATDVIDRKLNSEQIVEQVKEILTPGGDPFVDLAYDAISEHETLKLAVAVLRQGGQMAYVLPDKGDLVKKLAAEKQLETACALALLYTPENRGALAGLWEKFPELLEQGLIKPVPHEVLPGGLNGVPSGVKRLEKNQVSGVKLVVLPQETE